MLKKALSARAGAFKRKPSHASFIALVSIIGLSAWLGTPEQAQARMQCPDMHGRCYQEHLATHANLMNQLSMEAARAAEQAEANKPPPRPTQTAYTTGVVVWYSTLAGEPGVYVAAGQDNEADAAAAAMSNCYHAGGLNCRVGFSFDRGFAAIAAASDGSKFVGRGDNKGAARSAATANCRRAGKSCQIKGVYDSSGTEVYVQ
jgi:Domain of unknown function (DUF4189)